MAGCLTSLSLSMVSFLTRTRFFSGTDGLFILPLAFHPPVPSSPPHPAHLLDSTSRYKTWHKNMISGCIILSSPNDLLHLFSAYCLTQHYDLRPKHVALYLSTSFLLTAAPCYTVGITCLFDRSTGYLKTLTASLYYPARVPHRLPPFAHHDIWS